jgi:hypothetical protein
VIADVECGGLTPLSRATSREFARKSAVKPAHSKASLRDAGEDRGMSRAAILDGTGPAT